MSVEKLQILNMVRDGKVSAEEGVKLLDAFEGSQKNNYTEKKAKSLRIKVLDPKDETKVNVTLPVSLLKVGMKFASKFSPELKEAGLTEEDLKEILEAVDSGEIGKIVEVDSNDGTKVEVVIE